MRQERRTSQRVRCLLPVRLYPRGHLKVIETLSLDMSQNGLRVVIPAASVPAPKTFSLDLNLGDVQTPIQLAAEVVWSRPMAHSEQHEVGLLFKNHSDKITKRLSSYIEHLSKQPS